MPNGRAGMGVTAKAKDFKGTVLKLFKYLSTFKISLILSLKRNKKLW